MYSLTERRRQEDVPGGDTVLYHVDEVANFRLPTFGKTLQEANSIYSHLPDLKLRDDDIYLNSYPKTGTNWLWEMLNAILHRRNDLTKEIKIASMPEANSEASMEAIPSPRIINTHVPIRMMTKDAKRKHVKCILVLRNPKDVVVSFYNHTVSVACYEYDGKFENYLQMFMGGETDWGSYPKYLLEWQQFIRETPDWPVHIVYFENMKKDCFGEIKKLCKFLEQDVSEDYIADVVNKCDFKRMKQTKGTLYTAQELEKYKKVYKNGIADIMRKGVIGDWKNWFTVAHNEMFDDWWSKQTKDLNLFSFTYE